MRVPTHLPGERFGHWTLLRRLGVDASSNSRWWCVCDCGTEQDVAASNLISGVSRSCRSCGQRRRRERERRG